ncbi:MAG TPA: SDR family NAD(P)-dependent oxidoreductase [Verrucomicrobiota bacterium]|nr:SDR family NAD(P)-dependent oxidoreductase [Verrucomicrobiota bacterium]
MKPNELTGRVALVTGASRGLGRAMSQALAQAGARLALVSRDERLLSETAAAIREVGSEAEVLAADVTDEAQVLALEKAVAARFGRVDILINNAGINLRKRMTDFTLEEWNRIQTTNVTSAFLMCRSFVPPMRGQGYGRIINMTSMMSHISLPGRTAYSTSKAALLGFTKALALELATDAITVNGISPGPCSTEINKALMENAELTQFFISRIPAGRWGQPEEIGQLAVYLCSDAAGFITGTDIIIDGGWTAQ